MMSVLHRDRSIFLVETRPSVGTTVGIDGGGGDSRV